MKLWAWTEPMTGAEVIPSGDWLDAEYPGSPPLFTLVSCACVGAMPVGIAISFSHRNNLIEGTSMLMAMLAPVAGGFAFSFARRRRERWELIRSFVALALWLESIPLAILVFSLIQAAIRGVF